MSNLHLLLLDRLQLLADELDAGRPLSPTQIGRLKQELGDDVPLHFTAFHPDYRMMDRQPTPPETLFQARDIAIDSGLKYVYVGNVLDVQRESTYCPGCGALLIERRRYDVGAYELDRNQCRFCGHAVAGHFDVQPGHWGTRREPVDPAALLRSLESERRGTDPARD